jgi:lipopolysaccharide/colanic/teichoic acid biosynthesis glycosyltransferase
MAMYNRTSSAPNILDRSFDARVALVPTRITPHVAPHSPTDDATTEDTRPHVLSDELFRGALVRERRRADRTNHPFVLVVITACGTANWPPVLESLNDFAHETDVIGWMRENAAVGLLMPEMHGNVADARALETRLRLDLNDRLGSRQASAFDVQLYVHPNPKAQVDNTVAPVDPLLSSLGGSPSKGPVRQFGKRCLDVVGSLALLLVLVPVFGLIAALIRLLSPGPVFFRQVRIGEQARPFTMLKFRTMHVNAPSAIHNDYVRWFITSSGESKDSNRSEVFKITNDPRVTSIGRLLRKTSLDELPQLWNVLRGDMSLVGPRPPLQYEVDQYQAWHCRRVLDAKPGITGLWQVTGRSRTTFDEMVRLDIRYSRGCSVWTDIKILLATPRAVISGKGAC